MTDKELEELFKRKIHLELKAFEEKMLDLEPEEIYYNALRIDGMNNVFECLNEMSQKMESYEMKELLVVQDLLAFLCDCWMQNRDNSVEEMREYLQKEMIALCEKANGCDFTEGKGKKNGESSVDIKA